MATCKEYEDEHNQYHWVGRHGCSDRWTSRRGWIYRRGDEPRRRQGTGTGRPDRGWRNHGYVRYGSGRGYRHPGGPLCSCSRPREHYGEALAGKLLVDITNPVGSDLKSFVTPEDSFGALEIARAAPVDAPVVKAFNTQFSHVLAAGPIEGHPLDVFLAGDDAQAKARVSAFVESLGLRPMDTGPLAMARTLEYVCLLSLGLVSHAIKHTNFSIGISLPG